MERDINFYQTLKENCSVRTIKLWGAGFYIQNLRFLFQKLPNIRRVILSFISYAIKTILEMAQNLSKVELLSLRSIDERSISQ